MFESVSTKNAPAAIGPYSQAIRAGGFVFASGQIPVIPETGLIPDTIAGQAEQAFQNLKNILEAAGSSLSHTVKTTVFLRSLADFSTVNEIYAAFFAEPYPARSCVEVSGLPKGVLIEVEAVALI